MIRTAIRQSAATLCTRCGIERDVPKGRAASGMCRDCRMTDPWWLRMQEQERSRLAPTRELG